MFVLYVYIPINSYIPASLYNYTNKQIAFHRVAMLSILSLILVTSVGTLAHKTLPRPPCTSMPSFPLLVLCYVPAFICFFFFWGGGGGDVLS